MCVFPHRLPLPERSGKRLPVRRKHGLHGEHLTCIFYVYSCLCCIFFISVSFGVQMCLYFCICTVFVYTPAMCSFLRAILSLQLISSCLASVSPLLLIHHLFLFTSPSRSLAITFLPTVSCECQRCFILCVCRLPVVVLNILADIAEFTV